MFCKLCHQEINDSHAITHIHKHHLTVQAYYDTCKKIAGEGQCAVCGEPTRFINLTSGYPKYCKKCRGVAISNSKTKYSSSNRAILPKTMQYDDISYYYRKLFTHKDMHYVDDEDCLGYPSVSNLIAKYGKDWLSLELPIIYINNKPHLSQQYVANIEAQFSEK